MDHVSDSQIKTQRDVVGKLVKDMRTLGLEIAQAREKNEEAILKEKNEKFSKMEADFSKEKITLQNMEKAASLEKETKTVVNELTVKDSKESNREHFKTAIALKIKPERYEALTEIHREVFNAYCRYGEKSKAYIAAEQMLYDAAEERERHALLGTQGNLGGLLIPDDFRAEIVKNLAGFAVIRSSGARVVPTSGSTLVFPSIAGGTDPFSTTIAGNWRAEGSQGTDGSVPATQNAPTFGQERVPIHVWQPNAIVVTRELLEDSAVPLDSLMAQLLAETKALDEDSAFINGTGVGMPRGIMNYVGAASGPAISTVTTGSTGALTYNGYVDLMMNLKAQYRQNAAFLMRSTVFGETLKLKDSSQLPIMYSAAVPDTLFGKKVMISEFMPASASGANPVLFGDFRFYCIAERVDLRLQRLEERFAPNVAFLPTARLGGALLRTAAFVAAAE